MSRSNALAQSDWPIRFGWGPQGLRELAPHCRTVVIVDVLSFTTCVDIAVSRGAIVYPFRLADSRADAQAELLGATLAVSRGEIDAEHPWALSPTSLNALPSGMRLLLPSPNGATLAFEGAELGAENVLAGCFRNAVSVGLSLDPGMPTAVIAAGERWGRSNGPLRPAIEDLLGAGAILSQLPPERCSPEAQVAAAAFSGVAGRLDVVVRQSGSSRELIERGWESDVDLALAFDVSRSVPRLRAGAFHSS